MTGRLETMCFDNDVEPVKAAAPPETLKQASPDKKKTAMSDAKSLAIGTKRYRSNGGVQPTGGAAANASPTGIGVNGTV
jgi:hypothetical protein